MLIAKIETFRFRAFFKASAGAAALPLERCTFRPVEVQALVSGFEPSVFEMDALLR